MSVPFASFDDACKALPSFVYPDYVGQHKTISDLAFLVQHEMDLATEGEQNEIQCKRQSDTTKRWKKCRDFLSRCKATMESACTCDKPQLKCPLHDDDFTAEELA